MSGSWQPPLQANSSRFHNFNTAVNNSSYNAASNSDNMNKYDNNNKYCTIIICDVLFMLK